MFGLTKNHTYSIGVDISDDNLKIVQLGNNGNGISLIDGGIETLPENVKPGSGEWQKWAIEAIRRLIANGNFQGRDIIAAIPAGEVFIDHIRMTGINDGSQNAKKSVWGAGDKLADTIFSKVKQKLPFEPVKENTMIKYISTEDDNVLVMATERKIIDRHLAIYENADLKIKSIGVWPAALTNIYVRFFGRRKTDIEAIVMLTCIEANCTNVVICRHKNLLFARSISIGTKQLDDEKMVTRLALELTACKRQFCSMHRNAQIERLVFFSSQAVDRDMCTTIARQLEMPAQIGDCLAAVEITDPRRLGIDRRTPVPTGTSPQKQQVNWATAFGLSLS